MKAPNRVRSGVGSHFEIRTCIAGYVTPSKNKEKKIIKV